MGSVRGEGRRGEVEGKGKVKDDHPYVAENEH